MRRIVFVSVAVVVVLALTMSLAAAVEVSDRAPDFELPSTQGGMLKLGSFLGKKNLLIEFYVLEFTPT